jgi:hypothetical protein
MTYKQLVVSTFIISLGLFASPTDAKAAPVYKKTGESTFTIGTKPEEKLAIFTIEFEINDEDQDVHVPMYTFNNGFPHYNYLLNDTGLNYTVTRFYPECPNDGSYCGGFSDPNAIGIILSDSLIINNGFYLVPKGEKRVFTLAVLLPYNQHKLTSVNDGLDYGLASASLNIYLLALYFNPFNLDTKSRYTIMGTDPNDTLKKIYPAAGVNGDWREPSKTIPWSEFSTQDQTLN